MQVSQTIRCPRCGEAHPDRILLLADDGANCLSCDHIYLVVGFALLGDDRPAPASTATTFEGWMLDCMLRPASPARMLARRAIAR